MTPLQEEVRLYVQAALLNSQCSPLEAVEAAFAALTNFAVDEAHMTKGAFVELAEGSDQYL